MIDTTLDFSCNDDIPSSHNHPMHSNQHEISLQELLEEFNKGENPDLLHGIGDANIIVQQQANMMPLSARLGNGRPTHRRIKMASMNAQTLHADILKATKQLAEENRSSESIQKPETFRISTGSASHRTLFVNPPSLEGSRKNSQTSIKVQIPQEQTKVDAAAPFTARRSGRSQTLLAKSEEDAKKLHLPKIGAEGKLLLFKSNTETKVSMTDSRVNLIPENKSVGFTGIGLDKMFSSQPIGLTKVKSGNDLLEKKPMGVKLTSFGSENLIESSMLNKMPCETSQYIEPARVYEPKDGKGEVKPGRKIVFRKKSEPQIELIRKEAEDC